MAKSLFNQFAQIRGSRTYDDQLTMALGEMAGRSKTTGLTVDITGTDTITITAGGTFEPRDKGNYVVFGGSAYLITDYTSSSVVTVAGSPANDTGVSAALHYFENLEDDLNYLRTQIVGITGELDWKDPADVTLSGVRFELDNLSSTHNELLSIYGDAPYYHLDGNTYSGIDSDGVTFTINQNLDATGTVSISGALGLASGTTVNDIQTSMDPTGDDNTLLTEAAIYNWVNTVSGAINTEIESQDEFIELIDTFVIGDSYTANNMLYTSTSGVHDTPSMTYDPASGDIQLGDDDAARVEVNVASAEAGIYGDNDNYFVVSSGTDIVQGGDLRFSLTWEGLALEGGERVNEILGSSDSISAASTDAQLATAKLIYDEISTLSGTVGALDHNDDLSSLQGGNASEYYHLTESDYQILTAVSGVESADSLHDHDQYSTTAHTHAHSELTSIDGSTYHLSADEYNQISAPSSTYWGLTNNFFVQGNSDFEGNVNVSGTFGFDGGNTVNEIVTVISGTASDDQLVTEKAVYDFVTDSENKIWEIVDTPSEQIRPVADHITKALYHGGSVTIAGDLTVSGTTTTINSEELTVEDKTIEVNNGEVGAGITGAPEAGIIVNRGSEEDYYFVFDETYDNFRVGISGSTQAVATRENDPLDNRVTWWDTSNVMLTTSGTTYMTIDPATDIASVYAGSTEMLHLKAGNADEVTVKLGTTDGANYLAMNPLDNDVYVYAGSNEVLGLTSLNQIIGRSGLDSIEVDQTADTITMEIGDSNEMVIGTDGMTLSSGTNVDEIQDSIYGSIDSNSTDDQLASAALIWNTISGVADLQNEFIELIDTPSSYTDTNMLYMTSDAVADTSNMTYDGSEFNFVLPVSFDNNVAISGTFGFDEGTTVNNIVTSIDVPGDDDTLVTEAGIYNYVDTVSGILATAQGAASYVALTDTYIGDDVSDSATYTPDNMLYTSSSGVHDTADMTYDPDTGDMQFGADGGAKIVIDADASTTIYGDDDSYIVVSGTGSEVVQGGDLRMSLTDEGLALAAGERVDTVDATISEPGLDTSLVTEKAVVDYITTVTGNLTTIHNELAGLEGGNGSDEYYHLDANEDGAFSSDGSTFVFSQDVVASGTFGLATGTTVNDIQISMAGPGDDDTLLTEKAIYDYVNTISGAIDHNELETLQGGAANEYYHLNSNAYTQIIVLDGSTFGFTGNLDVAGNAIVDGNADVAGNVNVSGTLGFDAGTSVNEIQDSLTGALDVSSTDDQLATAKLIYNTYSGIAAAQGGTTDNMYYVDSNGNIANTANMTYDADGTWNVLALTDNVQRFGKSGDVALTFTQGSDSVALTVAGIATLNMDPTNQSFGRVDDTNMQINQSADTVTFEAANTAEMVIGVGGVDITNDLDVQGNVTVSGSFNFDEGATVEDIVTSITADDDTHLVTEGAVFDALATLSGAIDDGLIWEIVDSPADQIRPRIAYLQNSIYTEGNVTIGGDLTVTGTTFYSNTETVQVADNTMVLNYGEAGAGVQAGEAGIQIDRGSETDYLFVFDEGTDTFRVGVSGTSESFNVTELQPVATREDGAIDTRVPWWDDTNSTFRTEGDTYMTLNSGTDNVNIVAGGNKIFVFDGSDIYLGEDYDSAPGNDLYWSGTQFYLNANGNQVFNASSTHTYLKSPDGNDQVELNSSSVILRADGNAELTVSADGMKLKNGTATVNDILSVTDGDSISISSTDDELVTAALLYETITSGTVTSAHNDLSGLQGGTSGQYYHLTSAEESGLTGGGSTALHSHDTSHSHTHAELTSVAGDIGEYHVSANVYNSMSSDGSILTVSDNIDATGNVNVSGTFGFDSGNTVNNIVYTMSEPGSDDNLVSEQGIVEFVNTAVSGSNEFIELIDTPAAYAGSEGYMLVVNASGTAVEFDNTLNEMFEDSEEPTGFVNQSDSAISFSGETITISGTEWDYYIKGTKYTRTGAVSLDIDNTDEGTQFFYFQDGGDLQRTSTFTADLITDYAYVAVAYWNDDDSEIIYLGDERHGMVMDGATHFNLHNSLGTVYISGLSPTDYIIDGDGDDDAHAKLAMTAGSILDEDILISNSAVASGTGIPVFYKDGASGDWRSETQAGYAFLNHAGNNRVAWNENNGGTWQQTEVTDLDFVLVHLFATNDPNQSFISVQGQAEYADTFAAREGAANEISELVLAGMPFTEFVPVATFIVQSALAYGNATQARYVSTDDGDFVDWRYSNIAASTGQVSDHGSLAGLDDQDHGASAIYTETSAFNGALSSADDDVQKALDTLDNALAGSSHDHYDQDATFSGSSVWTMTHASIDGSVPDNFDVFVNGLKNRDDAEYYTASAAGTKLTVSFAYDTYSSDWVNVTYTVGI